MSDPLELELEAVVSFLKWMLGTELNFSTRDVHALSICLLNKINFYIFCSKNYVLS